MRSRLVPVLLTVLVLALGAVGTAVAKPGGGKGGGGGGGTASSPTSAIVGMGDSYISGEAGRWAGNSLDDADGSAIVVHEGPDDLQTDPSGDSGPRIACGVIFPGTGATPVAVEARG